VTVIDNLATGSIGDEANGRVETIHGQGEHLAQCSEGVGGVDLAAWIVWRIDEDGFYHGGNGRLDRMQVKAEIISGGHDGAEAVVVVDVVAVIDKIRGEE
jgi:hypothetical protein